LLCMIYTDVAPLLGQNGPTVIGAGYRNPKVINTAPGQVVTLFLADVKTLLPLSPSSETPVREQQATSLPLPVSLAGFSARVQQGANSYVAPILSIQQVPICGTMVDLSNVPAAPECWLTGLTVQIPLEIVTPGEVRPGTNNPVPTLIVSENEINSIALTVFPVTDNIHVLTSCDDLANTPMGLPDDLSCQRIVTHADGTPVFATSPGRPGEEIVIYAFGLGRTDPQVGTGEATPRPAPVLHESLAVDFDFRHGAGASRPYTIPNAGVVLSRPIFAGLTPDQVGLYQINVRLPDTFPDISNCLTPDQPPYMTISTVQSNLTINIGGSSFDGAPICVAANP
jgi:uncharacterized protein (TIGR03437 family)